MRWSLRFGVLMAGLVARPAAAQLELAAREVILTGATDERPATVYGAADVALTLFFDAPLQRSNAGVMVLLPGADVREHPHLANGLILTPSKLLSSQGRSVLRVPLADGGVTLALAMSTERADHVLRILRRPQAPDAGMELRKEDVADGLRIAADRVLGEATCNPLKPSLPRPEQVIQVETRGVRILACVAGPLTYVRVNRMRPACAATVARVLRDGQELEVLARGAVEPCEKGQCQALVIGTPAKAAADFEVLLLAEDGTVCERHSGLRLQPGGAP